MQHCIRSFILKENTGKASVGVAALPGASACVTACEQWQQRTELLGECDRESDRERKILDT
jgi:hypothetical protein